MATGDVKKLFDARARCESYLGSARVTLATTPLSLLEYIPVLRLAGASDLRVQLNGVLDSYAAQLDRLDDSGDIGRKLTAGQFSPASYAALVNEIGKGIEALLRDASSSALNAENLWNEVVAPTATEAKDLAEKAADRGQSIGTIIAVIAVAFAVVYVTSKVSK